MHFVSWWQFLGRSKQSIALIVFSLQEIKNKDLKLAISFMFSLSLSITKKDCNIIIVTYKKGS